MSGDGMGDGAPAAMPSIKLSAFEGPFDLLCHLIEKNKIDIYDIPISQVTDQYMEHIFASDELDLDIAGEFLVMAATLLQIKTRMLLPKREETGEGTGDESADPRDELVAGIVEYRRIKDAADALRACEAEWGMAFARAGGLWESSLEEARLSLPPQMIDIDASALAKAYRDLVESNREKIAVGVDDRVSRIIKRDEAPVTDKIRFIMQLLAKKGGFLFQKAFMTRRSSATGTAGAIGALGTSGKRHRRDIVAGFCAALELTRQNVIKLRQKMPFGPIFIRLADKGNIRQGAD